MCLHHKKFDHLWRNYPGLAIKRSGLAPKFRWISKTPKFEFFLVFHKPEKLQLKKQPQALLKAAANIAQNCSIKIGYAQTLE